MIGFFLQSDIVHQSVYELVHSEDREELQRQLMWNSFLPAERQAASLAEALRPDCCHLLERSFTVRFRCLLDNTSGFLVSFFIYFCLFIGYKFYSGSIFAEVGYSRESEGAPWPK